jgi:hypothetical protein
VYFDQYDLDTFFDQFLGPTINNNYPKCTYLHHVRFVEFVDMEKYLNFKKTILKNPKVKFKHVNNDLYECPMKFIGGYKHNNGVTF